MDLLSKGSAKAQALEAERSADLTELDQLRKDRGALVIELDNARRKWENERQDLELAKAMDVASLEDELAERREDLNDVAYFIEGIVEHASSKAHRFGR